MDVLNNEILTMLIQERQGPCLSIFTPTHRQWNELNQDMLRFKNQLKEAEKILAGSGMSQGEAAGFLQPAYRLSEDREFWNYQQDGLAVYISKDKFYYIRVPLSYQPGIYLNKRFYTKPLIPVYNGDRDFFILSLDVHNIRMFRGYHYNLREINLENIPVNMDITLGLDNDWEKKMQYRTAISAGNTQQANFHGHGSKNDATNRKKDIYKFFELLNDALTESILKNEKAPLILAGVDQSIPLYREANKYPYLYEDHLRIDADYTEATEMFDRANTLLDPYYDRIVEKELARYNDQLGTGKASDSPASVIRAAYENRIAVLFVNPDEVIWGAFDISDYKTVVHEEQQQGDEDLVDLAATQTLLKGGTIYTLPKEKMPKRNSMAAIFRF
jgi:hypothetical protein